VLREVRYLLYLAIGLRASCILHAPCPTLMTPARGVTTIYGSCGRHEGGAWGRRGYLSGVGFLGAETPPRVGAGVERMRGRNLGDCVWGPCGRPQGEGPTLHEARRAATRAPTPLHAAPAPTRLFSFFKNPTPERARLSGCVSFFCIEREVVNMAGVAARAQPLLETTTSASASSSSGWARAATPAMQKNETHPGYHALLHSSFLLAILKSSIAE